MGPLAQSFLKTRGHYLLAPGRAAPDVHYHDDVHHLTSGASEGSFGGNQANKILDFPNEASNKI